VTCEICGFQNKRDPLFQFGWRWLMFGLVIPFAIALLDGIGVEIGGLSMEGWLYLSLCLWWGIVTAVGTAIAVQNVRKNRNT